MTRIFLASSNELEADRRAFEIDVARRDQLWSKEGYRLFLTVWEHADDSMSATRKQDDTNATIAGADLFVVLVHTKVGMYTREEFEFAWEHFQRAGRPRIYTYFKQAAGAARGAQAADELVGACGHAKAAARGRVLAADWSRARLAALMLCEIGSVALDQLETNRKAVEHVQSWLRAGLALHPRDGGATARERAAMGDALSALGDPRFDPDRYFLPRDDQMIGFVPVPTSPAPAPRLFGSRRAPRKANFAIARYPVTVTQFRSFLRTTGREPGDPDALRDPASRPVRRVNWHEAIAYAKWLDDRLRHDPKLADTEAARLVRNQGWRVGLPNETEWELAARGGLQGKTYPWGDEFDPERANTGECGIGDTSVVGCFAANGFGLFDMAGNVWEWTRSLVEDSFDFDKAPNKPNPETEDNKSDKPMVLRGGAYNYASDDARCAFRGGIRPDFRFLDVGFRVVLRSAPVL